MRTTTNIFAAWIGTGLLLYDAFLIYIGQNLFCFISDASTRECTVFAENPVAFTIKASLLALLAILIYLAPFFSSLKRLFVVNTNELSEEEKSIFEEFRQANIPFKTSLLGFVLSLVLVLLLLVLRWNDLL